MPRRGGNKRCDIIDFASRFPSIFIIRAKAFDVLCDGAKSTHICSGAKTTHLAYTVVCRHVSHVVVETACGGENSTQWISLRIHDKKIRCIDSSYFCRFPLKSLATMVPSKTFV